MSKEKNKWGCNCRGYLKEQLNNLKSYQINAKQKIEELLNSKECPYKTLDKKSRENYSNFKSHWCSSTPIDPMENLSHVPNQNFIANAGIYTRCECGETIRRNWQWIDKSGEYSVEDDGWEDHIKNCRLQLDNQIKSNQIKSNQIKSNQIKSNQMVGSDKPKNYLPYILGGIGVFALIASLVWYFAKRNKDTTVTW